MPRLIAVLATGNAQFTNHCLTHNAPSAQSFHRNIVSFESGFFIVSNPLFARLSHFHALNGSDREAVAALTRHKDAVEALTDIPGHGADDIVGPRFLLDGYAARYTDFADGRRLLTSLLLPGDEVLPPIISVHSSQSVVALTDCRVSSVTRRFAQKALCDHPSVAAALQIADAIEVAVLNERITTFGLRTSRERLAHLFCEVALRSKIAGLEVSHLRCPFPLGQLAISQLLGISLVHVNRVLQTLRAEGLVAVDGYELQILDEHTLAEVAVFDPAYLHPPRAPRGGTRQAA